MSKTQATAEATSAQSSQAAPPSRLLKVTRRGFLGVAGLGALATLDMFVLEPTWLTSRKVQVGDGRFGLRIAHIADLHYKGDEGLLRSTVEMINAAGVDLVCLTGDLVEDRRMLAPLLAILNDLQVPLYAIRGNHDEWCHADPRLIAQTCKTTGGALVEGVEMDALGGRVRIAGTLNLDPPPLAPRQEDVARLYLAHYPRAANETNGEAFDLILAGHTHGGQFRIPFYGPIVLPWDSAGYDKGLFDTPGGPLHVSSGIGCWRLRARLFCRPEVALLSL